MAPLRNMFPNLVTKEEFVVFRKHVTSLVAIDFLVRLTSDVFVMTHGGNFAKLIIGARRYIGHRQKPIKPDTGRETLSYCLEQTCSPAYRHIGGLQSGLVLQQHS